jgi:hypothetical protein
VTSYDFRIIVMPDCPGIDFSGIGWVGFPDTLLNAYGSSYDDAANLHELGHNFGAEHASLMSGGSRGACAWKDSSLTWEEYGDPHSVMGSSGDGGGGIGEFEIEGKAVYDWVGDATGFHLVQPYSGITSQCLAACGPYVICISEKYIRMYTHDCCDVSVPLTRFKVYPTDLGSYPAGAKVGLRIHTATPNRYFFIEHRTVTTNGHAALISW